MYYLITTKPEAYGAEGKKKFGGPSVLLGKGNGIYSTTMYYLKKKYNDVDAEARSMMGPITSEEEWNFLRYANESAYGINTIVKEGALRGKIVIFSRTVITTRKRQVLGQGHVHRSGQSHGKFTASFKTISTRLREPVSMCMSTVPKMDLSRCSKKVSGSPKGFAT